MRRSVVVAAAVIAMAVLGAVPAQTAVVVRGVACDSCSHEYKWRPKTTEVVSGAKVTWKSVDGLHDVTSISKNWSKSTTIAQGQITSFTFNKTGTFRFRCTLHSDYSSTTKVCRGMCGRVVVG
jgi:plastocyanin